jgi:DNA helicase II / ATP-dependent DNA helicase PcrA
MDLLTGLNKGQQEMVEATDGPVLVLAGAGSGKTKALTHRIAYLISEKKVNPENILAITFTNKAAKEMVNRVETLIRNSELENSTSPTMGTFHSVCARILRKEAHNLGFSRSFVIFDEDDAQKLIKRCLKKLNVADQKISPSSIKGYISGAKNELLTPAEYANVASGPKADIAVAVYKLYQKELAANDALDFDDLLYKVVELFQKYPAVLAKYQQLWKYILIDEYQDTNQAQYLFAKLLAAESRNLCVVGDDWQSIYSWRGANFQNILNFERDWTDAKVIKLEQNYRSTKAILTAAQNVIEKNDVRSDKALWTENESGSPIYVYEARNEEDEAGFICREVTRMLASGGRLAEMAVFYRTNAQSRAVEEQLIRNRVPYKIVGGVRFYERKEIKDILAWIRVASGASDWVSFARSLTTPPSGIGEVSINKIRDFGEAENLKISGFRNMNLGQVVSPRTASLLSDYFQKITKIERAAENSLKDAIEMAINVSGYKTYLSDGSFQNEERIENLSELLSVADEYEKVKGKITLADFLEEVALISDLDNYKEQADGITLMTLHTAKGLEFKTVFIVGLEENIFPHSRSLFDPPALEEERRLFYVGITRARETLYLLYATSRLYFGNIQSNQPSRFLAEIPPALTSYVGVGSPKTEEKLSDNMMPGEYAVGDLIVHESFGQGKVVAVFDDELTIYFPTEGEKIVSIYYAPIKKV